VLSGAGGTGRRKNFGAISVSVKVDSAHLTTLRRPMT